MLTELLPTLQLPPDAPGQLLRDLRETLEPGGLRVFGGLPRDGVLQGVRLDAVAAALGTRLVAGQRDLLDASAAEVRSASVRRAAVAYSLVYRSCEVPRVEASPTECSRSAFISALNQGSEHSDQVRSVRKVCNGRVSGQVVVGAGGFTDLLRDVEAAEGRPLVVAPATRPDLVLGVGAAQAGRRV